MGYTHYWRYSPSEISSTEEVRIKFTEIANFVGRGHRALLRDPFRHKGIAGGFHDDQPCKIRGGLGEGKPIINSHEIWFNGDSYSGLSHETFHIVRNSASKFNFCKTARKPYDILVCYTLLVCDHVFNNQDVFSYTSDGDNEDWSAAFQFYKEITGMEPKLFEIISEAA